MSHPGSSVRIVGVACLLGAGSLAASALVRVPVYKVPWAQAKGRKLPSLRNEETGPRQADNVRPGNGGPGNGGPGNGGPEAIQLPEPAPPAQAKT